MTVSRCVTFQNVLQTQKCELYISLTNHPHPSMQWDDRHSLIHTPSESPNMAAVQPSLPGHNNNYVNPTVDVSKSG